MLLFIVRTKLYDQSKHLLFFSFGIKIRGLNENNGEEGGLGVGITGVE